MLRSLLARSSHARTHQHEAQFAFDLQREFGLQAPRDAALSRLKAHPFTSDDDTWDRVEAELPSTPSVGLADLLYAYFQAFFPDMTSKYLILKEPRFTLHLDALTRLFPDVHIINVVRDPRGSVASHKIRWPSRTFLPRVLGWRKYVRRALNWPGREMGRFTEIRFEDLVLEPQSTLRSICNRTGLPFEPELCEPDYLIPQYEASRPGEMKMKHFSNFDPNKIDAWQHTLAQEEIALTQSLCKREMERYGYVPSSADVAGSRYARFLVEQTFRTAYHHARGFITGA